MAMFMSMIFRKLEEIDDEDKKKCEVKAAKLKDDPMINFSKYYSVFTDICNSCKNSHHH